MRGLIISSVTALALLSLSLWTGPGWSQGLAPAEMISVCNPVQLKNHDCHFRLGSQAVDVGQAMIISRSKNSARGINIPPEAAFGEWQSVQSASIVGRNFVILTAWMSSANEMDEQSCQVYLFELKAKTVTLLRQDRVQTRGRISDKNQDYAFGPRTNFALLQSSDGHVYWQFGQDQYPLNR